MLEPEVVMLELGKAKETLEFTQKHVYERVCQSFHSVQALQHFL